MLRADHIIRLLRATLLAGAASLALGLASASALAQAPEQAWELDGVDRVVAISDIHGAQQAFVETLQSAGVVDAAAGWIAGRTHLVVVGDIVDRGDDSRAALDLMMRLEEQAAAAGGRVHFVLGNHELMDLVGDLRYVTKGEFAAFAADETAAMRDAAYAWHAARPPAGRAPLTRAEFDARFPPGFFGHRAAFSAGGRYGRWLLGKPLALRVNDTLFVHAGVTAALGSMSLQGINGALRGEFVEYVKLLEQLTTRGTVVPTMDFYELPALLGVPAVAADAAPAAEPPTPDPQVQRLLELQKSLVFTPASPLWYRGNVGCGPLVEQDRLAKSLQSLSSQRVVIGHTPTFKRQVWRRLDDKVWLIDAGMLRSYYQGQGAALLLEHGTMAAIYQGASKPAAVEELDDRAGALSANLAPAELEAALTGGEITARSPTPAGELLELRWQGKDLQALFRPASGPPGFFPEVAAYRLDRLLGLAMVPAAVLRKVDDTLGTLRFVPRSLIMEAKRVTGEARVEPWCPLQDQWQEMYLFDALIFNAPRTGGDLHYVAGGGQLVLTGHHEAFGTGQGIPVHLKDASLGVTALWRLRLAGLASDEARASLLQVLPKRQYDALVKRARALAR